MVMLEAAGKGALVGGVTGATLAPIIGWIGDDGYDWKSLVALGVFTGAITGALTNMARVRAIEYSTPQYPLIAGGIGAIGTGGALTVFRDARAGPTTHLIWSSLLGGLAIGSITAAIMAYRNK